MKACCRPSWSRICRAPYGARGLKSCYGDTPAAAVKSRPVWGAWIEISGTAETAKAGTSRAPYGARGLKSLFNFLIVLLYPSRPVWGAWIEMPAQGPRRRYAGRRAPYGARGLKFLALLRRRWLHRCRAPYGARGLKFWLLSQFFGLLWVAPRMGRVD